MTGIIRSIDTLGRICIPKEIRKILMINKNELMEMHVEGHTIVIEKANSLQRVGKMITSCLKVYEDNFNGRYIICDHQQILYSNITNLTEGTPISKRIQDDILASREYQGSLPALTDLSDDFKDSFGIFKSILVGSSPLGAIILQLNNESTAKEQQIFIKILAEILGKMYESSN